MISGKTTPTAKEVRQAWKTIKERADGGDLQACEILIRLNQQTTKQNAIQAIRSVNA